MKLLKDLSNRMNVSSMIIIHQPDPETFALFDRLILLSKGRCLFSDSCSNLHTFYENNYDEALPQEFFLAGDLVVKASAYDVSNEDDENYYKGEILVTTSEMVYDTSESSESSGVSGTYSNRDIALDSKYLL